MPRLSAPPIERNTLARHSSAPRVCRPPPRARCPALTLRAPKRLPRLFCVRPVKRIARASVLERRAIGSRLLEPSPSRSPAPERQERNAEIVLRLPPIRAEPARASVPPAPRDRPRPPPRAAPFRSLARRAPQAQCRDCSASAPIERSPLARSFLQRRAIGCDRLLEPRRPALPLAKPPSALPRLFCVAAQSSGTRSRVAPQAPRDRPRPPPRAAPSRSPARRARKRIAEIVLRHRPVERNPLARPLLQRRAIGRDRLLEPCRPALPLAERRERIAKIDSAIAAQSSGTCERG